MSCAFPPSAAAPDHAAIAEGLGFQRAWFYDSPSIYSDVWMTLARCADRTSSIGLGPGVAVPSLRHPMVTASCTAGLVDLVGAKRVSLALGTGFSARRALGQPAMKWAAVGDYVRCIQALLRGEVATWEGKAVQMLRGAEPGAARPIEVPILLGIGGPVGAKVAAELAQGAFLVGSRPFPEFAWQPSLLLGSVLRPGEDVDSGRVLVAAGPAAAAAYHYRYDNGRELDVLPKGAAFAQEYDALPDDLRHLALNEGHLAHVNTHDLQFIDGAAIRASGAAFTPEELGKRLAALGASGVSEVAYQPAGPDIEGELTSFAAAYKAAP